MAALNKRKPITETGTGRRCNVAVVQVLQTFDIPLLLEMIGTYSDALEKLSVLVDEESEEGARVTITQAAIEDLAIRADVSTWGNADGH